VVPSRRDGNPDLGPRLVHTPSEPSGSQRSPAVSSGRSFAQVADAILRKPARGQNPDKDEAGGSSPPRPTTSNNQRNTSHSDLSRLLAGWHWIKTFYQITVPRHEAAVTEPFMAQVRRRSNNLSQQDNALHRLGPRFALVEGRSHSDALVGCIVWSTTPSNSAESVSRSSCSRSRELNASMVLAAS
jgi:hypothetical protein